VLGRGETTGSAAFECTGDSLGIYRASRAATRAAA
jgi:hypothetical protein